MGTGGFWKSRALTRHERPLNILAFQYIGVSVFCLTVPTESEDPLSIIIWLLNMMFFESLPSRGTHTIQ
jgi:hypothetical protein